MGEEQFSDMEFNPMFRIGEHLAVVYPKLARMKFLTTRPKIEIKRTPSAAREEVTKEQWDLLCRYSLMFCWPHKSPLMDIKSWNDRSRICMECLGIDHPNNLVVKHLIVSEHYTLGALYRFWLQLSASDIYEMWFTLRTQFHNYNSYLRTPSGQIGDSKGTDIINITKLIPEIQKKIEDIERVLFPDDRVRKLVIEEETERYYAEKHAEEWKM